MVAVEFALEFAQATHRPTVRLRAEHIAGVANVAPDALSRLHQPDEGKTIVAVVAGCRRDHPAQRDAAWYRTLDPPALPR